MASEDEINLDEMLDECHVVKMDRHDSGFEESLAPSSDVIAQDQKAIKPQLRKDRESIAVAVGESKLSTTNLRASPRRRSTAPSSYQRSNVYSRRTSYKTTQSSTTFNRNVHFATRGLHNVIDRPRNEDPFVVHKRSMQLFPSPNAVSNDPSPARINLQRSFTSPSMSFTSHSFSKDTEDIRTLPEEDPVLSQQYTNYVPAANTDWMLPSTRLREYKKIDRSCRGVRGLWRRLGPRWCRRNSRLSFFEDDNSDNGSVRRYRLDLSENPNASKGDGAYVAEKDIRPRSNRLKSMWSCIFSK